MPPFSAIAFDRLLEPGASSKSMAAGKTPFSDPKLVRRNSTPYSNIERGVNVPRLTKPERAVTIDKKHHWAQISPALYATPESTPLPDSPSSFPPSPYIVNHKRRGPRLLKTFSQDDVTTSQRALGEENPAQIAKTAGKEVVDSEKKVSKTFPAPKSADIAETAERELVASEKKVSFDSLAPKSPEENLNGVYDGEVGNCQFSNGFAEQNGLTPVALSLERDAEVDDFFDPDSMSVKSYTEGESNSGVERSLNLTTPVSEFYDAWEELSSESGPQPLLHDIETELREIRLSLLVEIEKRKLAEDSLNSMRSQWLRIRQQLSLVGFTLPADPVTVAEDEQLDSGAEELCQQVYLARFVSESIGRGIAKAEVEVEMEAQIESKNFEIGRLLDKLHYYEAVNREMSQRNQEAVELARRLRQSRKRRQRWVWGSIAAVISLGSAALAWSYLPAGKGSSSIDQSHSSEGNSSSK